MYLKDVFFCLCLARISQPLFAFEWEVPHTGRKIQITWTRLPHGSKNSPTLFGKALAVDLSTFPEENPSCTLLRYIDDLLLTSHDREKCWEGTKALQAQLSKVGYKVFWKKAQVCQQEIHHLRGTMHPGSREEMGFLLHPSAEDQTGGPRFPRSSRILSHLDTQIFEPGQTTL
jgi:hypothetical protein